MKAQLIKTLLFLSSIANPLFSTKTILIHDVIKDIYKTQKSRLLSVDLQKNLLEEYVQIISILLESAFIKDSNIIHKTVTYTNSNDLVNCIKNVNSCLRNNSNLKIMLLIPIKKVDSFFIAYNEKSYNNAQSQRIKQSLDKIHAQLGEEIFELPNIHYESSDLKKSIDSLLSNPQATVIFILNKYFNLNALSKSLKCSIAELDYKIKGG